jgi:hypothetical protein
MPAYNETFPVDSRVRIRDVAELRQFQIEWKWNHPLEDDRLRFAGELTRVLGVGYFHGGDALYTLDGVPGVWHERCLEGAV